jgi:glycolate oxidase iron-sulfur subunit
VTGGLGNSDASIEDLLEMADQCVKCGYCLPHCPTFALAEAEAESPRGRVALIQGWLSGAVPMTARMEWHLDHCLECRACEPVCPSLVQFGALMDGARAQREARRGWFRRWLIRRRLGLLSRPLGLRLSAALGMLYRWLRPPNRVIKSVASGWPVLEIVDPLARRLSWPRTAARVSALASPDRYPASPDGDARPTTVSGSTPDASASDRAALFRGCIARLSQQPTESAAARVLTRLGFDLEIPDDQDCCGAIHRHNGYPDTADRLVARNAAAFEGRTLIGFASACVAELAGHDGIDALEICRFLVERPWPRAAVLAPLPATVAVHEPCSQRNQLRDRRSVYQLLGLVPELKVTPLAGNDRCCGAAGTYLTAHPKTALALAAPKIDALKHLKPTYLATTNTGCALHLEARARDAGLDIEVLHPVELFDRQLRTPL